MAGTISPAAFDKFLASILQAQTTQASTGDLQLERPNADYLDENKLYIPPGGNAPPMEFEGNEVPAQKVDSPMDFTGNEVAAIRPEQPPPPPQGGSSDDSFWQRVAQQFGPGYADARRTAANGPTADAKIDDLVELDKKLNVPKYLQAPPAGTDAMTHVAAQQAPVSSDAMSFSGDEVPPLSVVKREIASFEPAVRTKPSSTKRASAPGSGAVRQGENFAEAMSSKPPVAAEDDNLKALSNKQKDLERERVGALDKAAHAKDMSAEEGIAMALITLLPSLIGGLAGGAIAGKAGGAAGVAGGLSGAAQGYQGLLAGKEKDKEQALAQAAQAAARGDKIESEVSAQKQFGQKLGQDKELALLREKGDTQRAAARNKVDMQLADKHLYGQLRSAQIGADARLSAAEARAKAAEEGGAASLKDYQGKTSGFATKMMAAQHVLSQIQDPSLLNSFRSWGGLKNALASGDPQTQKYARAVEAFLDAVARDESGAAINENEYDRYFNIYFPRNTSSPEDSEYAAKFRKSALESMLARSGPAGARAAVQSYERAFGAPGQSTQPTQRAAGSSGGKDYVEWHP